MITRNSAARALFCPPRATFNTFPIVTVRKAATKLALRETEWFMGGDPKCPAELEHWWRGQLNPDGQYLRGYGQQLRDAGGFDQVAALIDGLRSSPHGRRHRLTTWRAEDAARITEINQNPVTPTPCHWTSVQFGLVDGKLCAYFEQRSGDLLLGVLHNWIQAWALLTWVAAQVGRPVGYMIWQGIDIHLYDEPSHIACAQEILRGTPPSWIDEDARIIPRLEYRGAIEPTGRAAADSFRAGDFTIVWPGEVPAPYSTIPPALL